MHFSSKRYEKKSSCEKNMSNLKKKTHKHAFGIIHRMLFINLVKIVIVNTFKFCLKTQQTTHPIGGFPVFAANQISLREF